mgnify:CR=1 FL=1
MMEFMQRKARGQKIADFVIGYRRLILIIIILVTVYFCFQITKLQVFTDFSDLLPQSHPYVKIHNKFREVFGGANLLLISVEVKQGTIFNKKTLQKVKDISEELVKIKGVDRYKILSLAQRKIKDVRITEWGIENVPIMYPSLPKNDEEMEKLQKAIYSNDLIYGTLVSIDSKAALILSDFFEEDVSYNDLYEKLKEIRKTHEDDNTIIAIVGNPMHLGVVRSMVGEVVLILIITTIVILAYMYITYKSKRGMLVPIIAAGVSGIWGLGFMSFMKFNLDPLVVVLPFLIALMTARHAMQKVNRYIEEYVSVKNNKEAARKVVEAMFMAGVTGIITDAFGIGLVALAPIPILQKISITCAFWSLATLVLALIFTPILLSYMPESENFKKSIAKMSQDIERETKFDRVLSGLGGWILNRGCWLVLGFYFVLIMVSFSFATKMTVGDVYPGSSLLWPNSRYNQDVDRIDRKFPGFQTPLYIVMEGSQPEAMKQPHILRDIESFQRYMTESPHVINSVSLADLIKKIQMQLRENHPKWEVLPDEFSDIGNYFYMLLTASDAGDFDKYITSNNQEGNIIFYCRNRQGDTIRQIIQRARIYIEKLTQLKDGNYKLGGGVVGVEAASNEVIERSEILNLSIALLGVLVFCSINYRSIVAGLILVVPLAISNLFAFAYMGLFKIGLTVSTYPVSSVGIGLGVDYGIYLVSRILEEREKSDNLKVIITNALKNNGRAIFVIASTLILGLVPWYFSDLRFQAEMGLLLAILLFFNALGALLLVPSFIAIFKPQFIMQEEKR